MNLNKIVLFSICAVFIIGINSCDKESDLTGSDMYDPSVSYDQLKGVDLGRVLFYDRQLSVNNAVSCGSCHKQRLAFSDDNSFSTGYDGRLTKRNSLPIQNLRQSFPSSNPTKLFWDGRESNLNEMVLRPIANHIEMGIPSIEYLVNKVSNISYYNDLFEERFQDGEITSERISYALAEFISKFRPLNTKFDRNEFTVIEEFGRQLFISKYPCNACHKINRTNGYYTNEDTVSTTFSNIGLDGTTLDQGRSGVTNKLQDEGKFKVPSLRNVALTGPYMHDGRLKTLDDVIDHYSSSMKNHPNLDPLLKGSDGFPLKLEISKTEKDALIAFLNTMTDFNFISNPSLSDPFMR